MAQVAVRQFAGDIRFWEFGTGAVRVPVILEPADPQRNQPVECNALTFGYEAGDDISVVSKRRDARYNQPIHTETLPGTTSVSATLLEIPPIILARILYGSASSATVSSGTVTEAVHEVTTVATPFQLPHRLLTGTPVLEKVGTPSNTALVAGTDYKIDLRRGQITWVSSVVAAGDDIEITYTYDAHVATTILGGAVPTKSFYITGDMQDRISGKNGELRIPEARLTVDGEVDWLSSEPIQAVLTGACVVADGEAAAYTFVEYGASA